MSLDSKLARYVIELEACLANTHRAEDRSLYEKYLASAAGILASCVLKQPASEIASRIMTHERLWGTTWLGDDIYRKAATAWAEAKKEAERAA